MQGNYEECHKEGEQKRYDVKGVVAVKGVYHQGEEKCGGNAGCGNDLGCRKHQTEDQYKNEENQRINEQNGDSGYDHAFAALEFKVYREHMADHTEKSCNILTGDTKQYKSQNHADKSLQYVTAQGTKSGSFAEGAEHIGHSCVSGAVVANVISVKNFGNDNGGVNASQKIGR